MYEFESCGEFYYCKELINTEPNWELEEMGTYTWRYYWTIELTVGYNIYWLPVALPFKSMSMLLMRSYGGMLAVTPADTYSDVVWPAKPITPASDTFNTGKFRFHVNCLTNTLTSKVIIVSHTWDWHGFFNVSLTDLNSYQNQYYEITLLPGALFSSVPTYFFVFLNFCGLITSKSKICLF
jgi:hypothetical protein